MASSALEKNLPSTVVLLVLGLVVCHVVAVAFWLRKVLEKPTRGFQNDPKKVH